MCEADAIALCKLGDTSGFDYLYNLHKKAIHSVCKSMLRNEQDAEDTTQDVFFKLVQKIDTFKSESKLSTWLQRIAINQCLMRLRRPRREVALYNESGFIQIPEPSEKPRQHIQAELNEALASLPERHQPYIEYVRQGYTEVEIAEMSNCSRSAAKARRFRARREASGKGPRYKSRVEATV